MHGTTSQQGKVKVRVHGHKDSLRARGIRLYESTWKELEAIQLRKGHSTMQDTVREAVEEYIAHNRPLRRVA